MAGRGAWIFASSIFIMGIFAFCYILGRPLFNITLDVAGQLSPWNTELYGVIDLIFNALPVAMLLGGIVLYVLVESNSVNDD